MPIYIWDAAMTVAPSRAYSNANMKPRVKPYVLVRCDAFLRAHDRARCVIVYRTVHSDKPRVSRSHYPPREPTISNCLSGGATLGPDRPTGKEELHGINSHSPQGTSSGPLAVLVSSVAREHRRRRKAWVPRIEWERARAGAGGEGRGAWGGGD